MKTIAFFSGYFLPHIGGIERYEYNLAKEFCQKGINVIIVTTRYEKSLPKIEQTPYAKVYRLPIYSLFSNRYPIIRKNREYKNILRQLEKESIDYIVLHTRFQLTSFVGAKFAKKHKMPRCVIEHGSSHFTVYHKVLDFFGHIYEHMLTKRIKHDVSDFYGVSKACCQWLEHFHIQAKGVLSNAVDTKEYDQYQTEIKKEKKSQEITILYAGRLIPDKGVLLLQEIAHDLKKKHQSITILLARRWPFTRGIKKRFSTNRIGEIEP